MPNTKATVGIPNVTADGAGNLNVNVQAGGGGGGTVQIEDTNGNPLDSNGSGALNVAVVSGGGSNPSVGTTGTTAPTSATEVGIIDNSGKLQGASSTNPVRIDPTGTTVQPISAISLPLPTNAAEETGGNLATIAGAVSSSVMQDNIKNWGGTAVTAPPATGVPAAGTEVAPVVKPIARKSVDLVYTGAITSGVAYTSAWFDSQATGAVSVELTVNFVGANYVDAFIDQSDDQTNIFSSVNAYGLFAGGQIAGTATQINVPIVCRYWRVRTSAPSGNVTSCAIYATTANIGTIHQIVPAFNIGYSTVPLALPVTLQGAAATEALPAQGIFGGYNGLQQQLLATVGMLSTSGTGSTTVFARTPNVFKTAQATASGNTALWTPTSGKKFRLLKLYVQVTAAAALASAGVLTITFQDSSTGIPIAFDVYLPATSISAPLGDAFSSGWIDLGNGVISATANNVLNINLSGTVSTGNVRVTCCGTEE